MSNRFEVYKNKVEEKLKNYCNVGDVLHKTVYEAMNKADDYMYATYSTNLNWGNGNQRHTLGDNSLRLDR